MDVTKAPPPTDLTSPGLGTAPNAAAASQSNVAAAFTPSSPSTAVTAVADRIDIQPLNVAAALQILIAEVRAELPLPGASLPGGTPADAELSDPALQANPSPALGAAEIVLSEMPEAWVPAGLALLESQAMPLNPSISAELPGLPDIFGVGPPELPTVEPLPEAPDLAAGGPQPLLPSPPFVAPPPESAPFPPQTPPGMGPPPWMGTPGGSGAGIAGGGVAPEPPTGGGPLLTALSGIPPSLDLDLLQPLLLPPGARLAMPSVLTLLSSPAQASTVVMRMFLQAVPQEAAHPATWSAAVSQLEDTLQLALDRAVSTVEQWRDVPQSVVDAAREARGLVMSQLSEEPPGPLWLRPEWMWLSPQMERFRRRRRLARRGLRDPDLWPLHEDDRRQDEPGERKEKP
jgi:hypothetical protein